MKLAHKMNLATIGGMVVVLAVSSFLQIRREIGIVEADARRDHDHIGRSLTAEVARVWKQEGPTRALELVHLADVATADTIAISWQSAPGTTGAHDGRLVSVFPLLVDGEQKGAIELSESLRDEDAYVRRSIVRAILTGVGLIAVASLIAAVLGNVLVGWPMRKLMERARRIGTGQAVTVEGVARADEIAELARELDEMWRRLEESRVKLAAETDARVATVEQLRHADRLATVGKLASGIAHELGTPLNVAAVWAKMLAEGEVGPERVAECGRTIGQQVERITRIVRLLLDFARGRGGGGRVAPGRREPLHVRQVVERVTGFLASVAAKRGVTLEVIEEATAVVDGDPVLLEQAIANLVVNAVHATPGPGRVRIVVGRGMARPPADHGGAPGSYVHVAVEDHGDGVSPEALPHIFEPFFTTKGVGEGTGLGLPVSDGIAREHGGWIGVETAPSAGSRFTVYLPGSALDETPRQRGGSEAVEFVKNP